MSIKGKRYKAEHIVYDRSIRAKDPAKIADGLFMARCADGDQFLLSVIAQSASRPNVMDLETLDGPTRLARPAVSLQDFAAELTMRFGVNPQPSPLGAD